MKSIKTFEKAVQDIGQNLETKFEKAASEAASKNADKEHANRDADDAGADTANTATDAAHDEEGIPSQKWKEVKDLADKVSETVPKAKQAGRYMWLKALGGIAAVGFCFASLNTPNFLARNREISEQQNIDQMSATQIQLSADQFNIMVGGLAVPTALPAAEPVPVAVAAAAPEPVEVEVTTATGTRTFSSTVGQVYQNVPEAQHVIEQTTATPIEHGYDHADPNSCVATDCLNQHRDQGFHKEFTVDSPVGSAHFKY